MAELVDALDSKSNVLKKTCRFEPGFGHKKNEGEDPHFFVPRRHLLFDWGMVSQTPFLSLRSTAGAPSPSFFCARWLKSESGNQDGIDTTSLGNQSIHTSSIRRRKSSGVNTFVNIVSNSRR